LAAIVEATCFLNIPLDRIDVLSVGTTEEPFNVRKQATSGIFGWGTKFIGLLMNAQAEVLSGMQDSLPGSPASPVNVVTSPGSYTLDSPKRSRNWPLSETVRQLSPKY